MIFTSPRYVFCPNPALIPFETTVLGAALSAFVGMWALNKLPQVWHPLFKKDSFHKTTDDGFFISVECDDGKFDRQATEQQQHAWHEEQSCRAEQQQLARYPPAVADAASLDSLRPRLEPHRHGRKQETRRTLGELRHARFDVIELCGVARACTADALDVSFALDDVVLRAADLYYKVIEMASGAERYIPAIALTAFARSVKDKAEAVLPADLAAKQLQDLRDYGTLPQEDDGRAICICGDERCTIGPFLMAR